MGQKNFLIVPMLIFALLVSVLQGCNRQLKNSTVMSDKTISIQRAEPIVSRMYYVTSNGLQVKDVPDIPKPEDLDYLDYWIITFKCCTDTLVLSCKGANGEMENACFRYKFEDGFLKVFNPDKPLWQVVGYGDKSRISFFVDFVVYKNSAGNQLWINLDFCPNITMEDALKLNEQDLFSTVSDLTLGNISSYVDLKDCHERIYWRLIAYILE